MGYAEQLAERLRAIEAAAARVDAGDGGASAALVEALLAVFQQTPSLLSYLNATYIKVASCVPRPPYPGDKFSPLVDVVFDLAGDGRGATTGQASGFPGPGFRPRLGAARGLRSVQAPDWWRTEPVMLVGHSRVTRRDVVLAAAGGPNLPESHLFGLLLKAGWTGLRVSPFGEAARVVPVVDAARAMTRQIAHEVLLSPELGRLARGGGLT